MVNIPRPLKVVNILNECLVYNGELSGNGVWFGTNHKLLFLC